MPKSGSKAGAGPVRAAVRAAKGSTPLAYCTLKEAPVPVLPDGLSPDRMRAIIVGRDKWVNGTVLRYYFYDQPGDTSDLKFSDGTFRKVSWVGDDANRKVVHATRSRRGNNSASGSSSPR